MSGHGQVNGADAIDFQQQNQRHASDTPDNRKPKAPSVRKACVACHTGKTRCSESLPCASCMKRGLADSCSYPDPEAPPQQHTQAPSGFATPIMYAPPQLPPVQQQQQQQQQQQEPPTLNQQPYYDYNGSYSGSSSTFRPNKRQRNLTEEETTAITRNFIRGDFYVGNSAPVRIDPRLPLRLTLDEDNRVHFAVGETFT